MVHILTLVRWFVSIKTETVGSDAVFMRQKMVWAAFGRSIISMAILSYSYRYLDWGQRPPCSTAIFGPATSICGQHWNVFITFGWNVNVILHEVPEQWSSFKFELKPIQIICKQIVPTQSTQIYCICIHLNDNYLWPRGLLFSVNMTITF